MRQRTWANIEAGEHLPAITDTLSFTRVAAAPAATLDWYPLHHDPEYARGNGQPGIVMSTLQIMGLVDRAVTEWAGPATFIRRRDIQLKQSIFAHDVVTCTSTVRAKHNEPDSGGFEGLVEVDVEIVNANRVTCCVATVTIAVPTTSPGSMA